MDTIEQLTRMVVDQIFESFGSTRRACAHSTTASWMVNALTQPKSMAPAFTLPKCWVYQDANWSADNVELGGGTTPSKTTKAMPVRPAKTSNHHMSTRCAVTDVTDRTSW
jgi:hypothetical protein